MLKKVLYKLLPTKKWHPQCKDDKKNSASENCLAFSQENNGSFQSRRPLGSSRNLFLLGEKIA